MKTRKVRGVGLRQIILSPRHRSIGALALGVYTAAQILCFLHCNFGGGHGDSPATSCHAGTTRPCHDDNAKEAPAPAPTAICFTLKNMLVGDNSPILVVPDLFDHYLLAPCPVARAVTAPESQAIFARQANHRQWVLTPEVSLGPAFRSLAPPFIG